MSSFKDHEFRVKADDGYYPQPKRDNEGVPTLEIEVMFQTRVLYDAFQNLVARGTAKVPNGTVVVNWHSNAGGQTGTLDVPVYQGSRRTYNAVLIEFSADGLGRDTMGDEWFRGNMTFVILSPLTSSFS